MICLLAGAAMEAEQSSGAASVRKKTIIRLCAAVNRGHPKKTPKSDVCRKQPLG